MRLAAPRAAHEALPFVATISPVETQVRPHRFSLVLSLRSSRRARSSFRPNPGYFPVQEEIERLMPVPMPPADLDDRVLRLRLPQYLQNLLFTVCTLAYHPFYSTASKEPSKETLHKFCVHSLID